MCRAVGSGGAGAGELAARPGRRSPQPTPGDLVELGHTTFHSSSSQLQNLRASCRVKYCQSGSLPRRSGAGRRAKHRWEQQGRVQQHV